MESKKQMVSMTSLAAGHRAYIYQQLNELQPYCLPGTQFQAEVLFKNDENDQVSVDLSVFGPHGNIQARGTGDDIFQATNHAKEKLLEFFVKTMAKIEAKAEDAVASKSSDGNNSGDLH